MMPRCYIVVLFFAYGYTLSLMAVIIDAKLLLMHHHHLALIHHQPSLIPFRGRLPKQQRRIYNPQLSCCQGRDIKIACTSNIDDDDSSSARRTQVLYVAKTIESFKLADVYWLESCVMAAATDNMSSSCMDNNDISVDRLAFHRPTASYLLGYNVGGTEEISSSIKQLPFRTNRFQYVAKVITSGTSPQDLLKNIGSCSWSTDDDCNNKPLSWILDYDTFEPMQKKSFSSSSTMLMCAISRLLPGEPVLSTVASIDDDATTPIAKYIIIETASLLYLVQKMLPHHNEVDDHSSNYAQTATTAKRFKDIWSKRPFQYSGAINLDVAIVIIDTLQDILRKRSREDTTTTTITVGEIPCKAIRILDPTCGSGTFLALPLMMWRNEKMNVEVVGIDSNEKCVEGTVRNLKHVYKEAGITINNAEDDENDSCWNLTLLDNNTHATTTLSSKATIYAKDSVHMSSYISQKFDCAVANLPWNRNTFEYDEGSSSSDSTTSCINSGILNATAAVLKPGAPLVVVSGRDNNDDHDQKTSFNTRISLEKLGLHVIGEATIPPMGFDLPVSTKKRDNTSGLVPKKKKRVSRSSDCMITVAITPQR